MGKKLCPFKEASFFLVALAPSSGFSLQPKYLQGGNSPNGSSSQSPIWRLALALLGERSLRFLKLVKLADTSCVKGSSSFRGSHASCRPFLPFSFPPARPVFCHRLSLCFLSFPWRFVYVVAGVEFSKLNQHVLAGGLRTVAPATVGGEEALPFQRGKFLPRRPRSLFRLFSPTQISTRW